jgi:hypothetical protein
VDRLAVQITSEVLGHRRRTVEYRREGSFLKHLLLFTDDAQHNQILMLVSAVIQSSIVASPAPLFMGVVPSGPNVSGNHVALRHAPHRSSFG